MTLQCSRKPLEQLFADGWRRIDPSFRRAFFVVVVISLLAFGFEMTNLTLHHDDVSQIFIEDTILGHYLGRFGTGWLHYYTQGAHFMPFLQMAQGIVLMALYGMLVARFWGLRRTLDLVLGASVMCVFPYMAQVFQYNTTMATYSVAHLLVAVAVILSARATVRHGVLAALAYFAAFSIYQSVIANAAAIFGVWLLGRALSHADSEGLFSRAAAKSTAAAAMAVAVGGLSYVAVVAQMNLQFDSYQGAGDAFTFKKGLQLSLALPEILNGTRAFFLWPESYFPDHLKKLQLGIFLGAAAICVWLPKGPLRKIAGLSLLLSCLFAPRLLQLLHPQGHFHNLTLTAYAVVVAGFLMVLLRSGHMLVRNVSALLAVPLVVGYLIQCNWISTVGHLNTLAHYATMNRIMAQIATLPADGWDGKTVAVRGRHGMYSGYPFKQATGVASEFIDAPHMQLLSRLLRQDMAFIDITAAPPAAREYAAKQSPWPRPGSLGVAGGMAVIVLSNEPSGSGTNQGFRHE
jgi:hypothetical protein